MKIFTILNSLYRRSCGIARRAKTILSQRLGQALGKPLKTRQTISAMFAGRPPRLLLLAPSAEARFERGMPERRSNSPPKKKL